MAHGKGRPNMAGDLVRAKNALGGAALTGKIDLRLPEAYI
jgi:hypothetical protein